LKLKTIIKTEIIFITPLIALLITIPINIYEIHRNNKQQGGKKMKVEIKKLSPTVYEIIKGSEFIDDKVWGHTVKIDGYWPVRYFHSSWLNDVIDVCYKFGYKLEIQSATEQNNMSK
jgi:hypothetical protein